VDAEDIVLWASVGVAGVVALVTWVGVRASRRQASAAEGALADQRSAAAAAARARVELRISRVKRSTYVLRNYGEATAVNIRLARAEPTMRRGTWPGTLTLANGEGHRFGMDGAHDVGLVPPDLRVVWDGQDDPVTLPMP
jgi:type II secretory pathway pseudopilin PulG